MKEAEQEPLDERLQALARGWHEPPAVPRDEIWQAIAEARKQGRTGDEIVHDELAARRRRRVPFQLAAGIAALLVLGVGIGRMTAPDASPVAPPVATAPDAGRQTAFRYAADRHLEESELYLTLFRASVHSGRPDDVGTGTARELLLSNRLLLDSPASEDPQVRRLLEDLELVLAQIAQLPAEGTRADAGLITDGMEAGSVLPRLRSATSGSVAATLRQGAL